MELIIKNKWVSLGGSSTVQDATGKDLLVVKGKFFTFTSKKYINDLEGKTLYVVRNKFWRLFQRKAFVEDAQGNILATIRRKIFSMSDHYFIESSSLGNLEIKGNILQYNYNINLNGESVGHIARKVSLRDSFVLTIDDKQDYVKFVALVIAIDNITDKKDRDSRSD